MLMYTEMVKPRIFLAILHASLGVWMSKSVVTCGSAYSDDTLEEIKSMIEMKIMGLGV